MYGRTDKMGYAVDIRTLGHRLCVKRKQLENDHEEEKPSYKFCRSSMMRVNECSGKEKEEYIAIDMDLRSASRPIGEDYANESNFFRYWRGGKEDSPHGTKYMQGPFNRGEDNENNLFGMGGKSKNDRTVSSVGTR